MFEGQKVVVENIEILGNNITNETVIRSELLLDEGDPFSKVKVDKSISNLKSKRIFSSVKEEIADGNLPNSKKIKISVEEMPTGEISAGAGIGTNGGSFAFSVKENNYLGRGVKVAANADVSENSVRGSLSFIDTNYNYTGKDLRYNLENIKNDSEDSGYENRVIGAGVSIAYEQFKDIYFSPGLNLTFDDLSADSSASALLKKQSGTSTDLNFNYGLSTDQRDRSFMPTSGHYTSFTQVLPLFSEEPYIKNGFTSNHYREFNDNIIGAFKFNINSVNSLGDDDVRVSKRLPLSTRKLRGFKPGKIGPKDGNDYIGGNYSTAVNLEANFPNFFPEKSNAEVGLFLDAGNLWGVDYDSSLDDSNKIRSSLGINTSWLSPAGPLSFIFSKNITKASTDQTQSFNFRLGTTF